MQQDSIGESAPLKECLTNLRAISNLSAVRWNFEPAVFHYASDDLRLNEDLFLWALSDAFYVEQRIMGRSAAVDDDLALPTHFVHKIDSIVADLRRQQTFERVFLMAVRHQRRLGLLRDPVVLRSIRDYTGIACGNKLLR